MNEMVIFPEMTFKTDLAAYFCLSLALAATRKSPEHKLPCLKLPIAEHSIFTFF